jgi:hypothetical protein
MGRGDQQSDGLGRAMIGAELRKYEGRKGTPYGLGKMVGVGSSRSVLLTRSACPPTLAKLKPKQP